MDIFYIVGLAVIIAGVIAYATVTNKIIREQDEQIAALVKNNRILRTAASREQVQVISIYEQPQGVNVPSFEKDW